MSLRLRVTADSYLDSINEETWKFESQKVASEGDIVYEYRGHTYGVITPLGLAVTKEPGQTPFFEVPLMNLEPDERVKAGNFSAVNWLDVVGLLAVLRERIDETP